jgi:two-component system, NarL family, nitrate/nitrite response regulator NarL
MDIVLASGHRLLLDVLGSVLQQRGHRVVASVVTLAELLGTVRTLQPETGLIYQLVSDREDLAAIGSVLAVSPLMKVILVTADASPESMRRALAAGAVGYLHRSRGVSALSDALDRIAQDEIVVAGVVRAAAAAPRVAWPRSTVRPVLTERERQCLTMLTGGMTTTTMARQLGVSPTTVRSHVQAVLTKLGVHTRLAAASVAVRYSLVEPNGADAVPAAERARQGEVSATA